jgi:SAM-dependent methyltransferase
MNALPKYDTDGLHILDPRDKRGYKSNYITLIQEKALRRHLPAGEGRYAADLGCGYGRLTPILGELGWRAIGIDPALDLIEYARTHHPGPEYRHGGLPDLPVDPASVSLMLIQNVLRALKMMNRLDAAKGMGRFLADGARVLLVENIRSGHPAYLTETQIVELMRQEGLSLIKRVPLRAARWCVVYLIRYGFIPEKCFSALAEWELNRMSGRQGVPRWQYWNVLLVFGKKNQGLALGRGR